MKRSTSGYLLILALSGPILFDPGLYADTYPRQPDVDVLSYAFELALSDSSDEIVGRATIEVRFLVDGVTGFELDLIGRPAGAADDAAGRSSTEGSADLAAGEAAADGSAAQSTGMTVTAVSAAGEPVAFTHEANRLRIKLRSPSRAKERRGYTIEYRGVPATGLIIGDNKHGDRTFFSDNWPDKARHWLPTLDHPCDKASSEMIVTAPSHYQVISNGLLVEQTDLPDGMRLTHWKQSVPIPTWLYVLGVARFAVQYVDEYRGRSIQTWVYAQDRDAGFYDFAVPTKQVLEFYGEFVGAYSYEKLANVQSNSVGGGMEAATAIFYGDNSVTGERSVRWRNVIIHEIAHQWFGNSVTESDWDDVWLSEGFATYFTSLFIEHAYGRDEFVRTMRNARRRVFDFYEDRPDYTVVHDNLDDMSQVTTGMQYQKGAWILHMLRGIVGDDAFWRGIQRYYREYQNKNAATEDFVRVMGEVSGQDLSWFFPQWLNQGGNLHLEGGWSYDAEEGQLHVELEQVQDPATPFNMPVQIGIYIEGQEQPRLETLRIDKRQNRFVLSVKDLPTSVVLDPHSWVLMEAEFRQR